MGTRSSIIEQLPNGQYRGIYCHWDGYLDNNGKILFEHYQDAKKVSALIDLGDISSLNPLVEPPIGAKHSFDKPYPGIVVAYHRDRGEPKNGPYTGTLTQVISATGGDHGYTYVFSNGTWWVKTLKHKEGILLEEALKEKEDE